MRAVNVHEAKTNLSKLLQEVENGQPVLIARAGKVVAKLVPADTDDARPRLGFMGDRIRRVSPTPAGGDATRS